MSLRTFDFLVGGFNLSIAAFNIYRVLIADPSVSVFTLILIPVNIILGLFLIWLGTGQD